MSESDTPSDLLASLESPLSRRALLRRGLTGAAALSVLPSLARSAMAASAPSKGGTLVMARIADVLDWDPITTADNMSLWGAWDKINSGMMRADPAATGWVPDLAESWKISDNGRTYTFHLKPNLRFSDGSPLKASDAVFCLNREAHDPKSLGISNFPKGMKVTAPDDRTFVVTLPQANAAVFEEVGLNRVYSEASFKQHGVPGFAKGLIAGSGPWTLATWAKGDHILLKRNPQYWRPAHLDAVKFVVMADANSRVLRLKAGEIDIASDPPFNQLASLKNTSGIKVGVWPELGANTIWLNHKKPFFQDPLVRQAMNYAVDKAGIIQTAYFGYARPQISILPANRLTDWSQKPYAYNVDKAKALLAKSKYPKGFSTVLLINGGDPVAEAIATIAKANLSEIGINVTINPVETNTKNNLVYKYKYEMNMDIYTSDQVDPAILFEFGAVGHQFVDSYFTHYYNAEVNKLWNQSNLQFASKRAATYKKMQQIVWKDAPDIFLTYLNATAAMRSNVQGFVINPTAHYFLEQVWKS